MIQQVRIPIADTDNVGIVHDKLMMLGGKLVTETVDAILNDAVKPIPQEEMAIVGELRPAPKILKIHAASIGINQSNVFMILSVVCLLIRLPGQNWFNPMEKR